MNEAGLVVALQGYIGLSNQLFLASISGFLFTIVSALLLFGIFLSRSNAEELMTLMLTKTQTGRMELGWLGSNVRNRMSCLG